MEIPNGRLMSVHVYTCIYVYVRTCMYIYVIHMYMYVQVMYVYIYLHSLYVLHAVPKCICTLYNVHNSTYTYNYNNYTLYIVLLSYMYTRMYVHVVGSSCKQLVQYM